MSNAPNDDLGGRAGLVEHPAGVRYDRKRVAVDVLEPPHEYRHVGGVRVRGQRTLRLGEKAGAVNADAITHELGYHAQFVPSDGDLDVDVLIFDTIHQVVGLGHHVFRLPSKHLYTKWEQLSVIPQEVRNLADMGNKIRLRLLAENGRVGSHSREESAGKALVDLVQIRGIQV